MTTATLPRIHDLPPAERQAEYDAALERVKAASRQIAAERNARKPDPRSILDYRAWRTMRMVCILVVKHRDKPASFEVSRAGSWPHIYLPIRKTIVQPESTSEFIVAVIPKAFLTWLASQPDAPKGVDQLLGVTPDLEGEWTDAQRETWSALRRLRLSINSKIYTANRRSPSVLSRSAVA
jgi:hypothetical protein